MTTHGYPQDAALPVLHPFLHNGSSFGALEIHSFEEELSSQTFDAQLSLAGVAASIASAQSYECDAQGTLSYITSLTELHDLERVFSSTPEMEELLSLIAAKFLEILV